MLFEVLSQEERDAIIDPKGTSKLPTKELNVSNGERTSQNSDLTADDNRPSSSSSKTQGKKKVDEVENDTVVRRPYNYYSAIYLQFPFLWQANVKNSRPKKPQDSEKVAKVTVFTQMTQVQNEVLYYQEKERLEKKLARAEREQKEKEAQNKSQSIMAKFFAKPKASSPANVAVAGPSKLQSDFERTFKPFVLGKDKVLAPANWFLASKKRKTSSHSNRTEVILIDSDDKVEDDMMQDVPSSEELNKMSPQGMFSRFHLAKFYMLDLQIVCIIFF